MVPLPKLVPLRVKAVIVPAIGVVPPVAENVIEVELGILSITYSPPEPNDPVPFVAVITSPANNCKVSVIPVILPVQGLL